jgi:hypothetical protein
MCSAEGENMPISEPEDDAPYPTPEEVIAEAIWWYRRQRYHVNAEPAEPTEEIALAQ